MTSVLARMMSGGREDPPWDQGDEGNMARFRVQECDETEGRRDCSSANVTAIYVMRNYTNMLKVLILT